MSDKKHGEDELFDTTATDATDSSEDTVSTTDKAEPEATESSEENTLNLEPADEVREKQKTAWLKKIKTGDATIEELKTKQPWLAELVSNELKAEEKAQKALEASKVTELAKEIAQRETTAAMARAEEANNFKATKEKLNSVGTTKAQRATIKTEYDNLKEKLGSSAALEVAIRLSGVNLDDMSARRKATSVPTLGDATEEMDDPSKQVMDQASLSPDALQKLVKSKSKNYRS